MPELSPPHFDAPTTHVLYLHGFRSSPQSFKAQQVAQRLRDQHPQVHWWCPQLPASPAQAAHLLIDGLRHWPRARTTICGSSLGGFYARWLHHVWGGRAVLLNPAPHPARDLAAHIGQSHPWHDPAQHFHFQPSHVEELRALELALQANPEPLQPDTVLAIVAQGDEVLDWREMLAFCAGACVQLLPGGDHALSDFDPLMEGIFDFMRLPPSCDV